MFERKKDYSVKPMGRAGIVYREGEMTLHIFSELLAGKDFDMVVYLSRVAHWDEPNANEELTDAARQKIKERIVDALKVRVEWA